MDEHRKMTGSSSSSMNPSTDHNPCGPKGFKVIQGGAAPLPSPQQPPVVRPKAPHTSALVRFMTSYADAVDREVKTLLEL